MNNTNNIPTIDFVHLKDSIDELQKYGFLLLSSLPYELNLLLEQVKHESDKFFGKSEDEKMIFGVNEFDFGYIKKGNIKEGFQVRLSSEDLFEWPDQNFKNVSFRCFQEMHKIGSEIINLIGNEIEIDKEIINKSIDNISNDVCKTLISSSVLDFFRYININNNNVNKDNVEDTPCRPHIDTGLITIIASSGVNGLELYNNLTDQYVDIDIYCNQMNLNNNNNNKNNNFLVIMVGETLDRISENKYKGALHKVVNKGIERTSIVFKFRASPLVVGPRSESDYKIIKKILQK